MLLKSNPVWKYKVACPLCSKNGMEFVQMIYTPWKDYGGQPFWQEVWNCDSCHTNHTFPARLEVMESIKGARLVDQSSRSLYLPK